MHWHSFILGVCVTATVLGIVLFFVFLNVLPKYVESGIHAALSAYEIKTQNE